MSQHRSGNGARLTQVAVDAGLTLDISATGPGTRSDERRLHNRHGSRVCPWCNPDYNSKIAKLEAWEEVE